MFEVPRRRQAANNDAAASMRVPYLGLGAAFVGQVATSGGGADTFHDVVPMSTDGSMALGDPISFGTFSVNGPNVRVLVLGPARPVGSNLIARRVDGEWVASRLRSIQVIKTCGCPWIPNTIQGGQIYYDGYTTKCQMSLFPDAIYEPNGTFTYPDSVFHFSQVLRYTGPLWRTPIFSAPGAITSGSIVIVCNLQPFMMFSTGSGSAFEYYDINGTVQGAGPYHGDCPIPDGSCTFHQVASSIVFWYTPT